MSLAELKKTEIRRKAHIPDDDRTPGKDEVADYIESEIIEKGRWPMDIIEIADEVDYSRQHITNVVKDYFEPAPEESVESEETDDSESKEKTKKLTISVPDGMDPKEERAYLMGVAEGRRV